MLTRRLFVSVPLAALVAVLTLSALTAKADDWRKKFPTIKYGIISVETQVDTMKNQDVFLKEAKKELGVPVELFTATEYAGIVNALATGQIQLGWLGASSYATTWLDCKCVEPLVGAQDVKGAMGYNSVLIVKADSPYKSYEDLKGKTVARNDPHSTSGFTVPTVEFAEMGKPIDKYFNSPLSGGHQQTIVGVLNGTYDGGFTWTTPGDGFGAIRKMIDKGVLKRDQIRVIWTSPMIPTPPVVIRSDLPPQMKADLEKMFVRLVRVNEAAADAVAQGKTLGLQRVYHEDYVPIIKAKQWLKQQRKKGG